jgi:Fe-S-cluster-containing hydrogenase component 2
LHYLRKLWPWSPRFGLARFQQNYVVEGLPPFPPDHRAFAHEAGRCTGCGACDDACPILAGSTPVAADDFAGPASFVVSGARSTQQLDDLAFALDTMTGPVCAGCRACDRACPEHIPVTSLAAALQAQRRAVQAARTETLPVLATDVARLADAARALSTARAPRPAASGVPPQGDDPRSPFRSDDAGAAVVTAHGANAAGGADREGFRDDGGARSAGQKRR